MECSECKVPLQERSVRGVDAFACPQCAGFWFPDKAIEEMYTRAQQKPQFEPVPKQGTRACSVCAGVTLQPVHPNGMSRIVLDSCPSCQGVWFDAFEAEDLEQMLSWMPVPKPAPPMQHGGGDIVHRLGPAACPKCGEMTTGSFRGAQAGKVCHACGWSLQTPREQEGASSEPPPTMWVVLAWVACALVTAVPFVVIHAFDWQEHTLKVWGAFVLYVGCAVSFAPKVDTQDLGWFGGMVDNPFSYSDDWNRGMLFLNLFLLPGKAFLYAFRWSWALWKG